MNDVHPEVINAALSGLAAPLSTGTAPKKVQPTQIVIIEGGHFAVHGYMHVQGYNAAPNFAARAAARPPSAAAQRLAALEQSAAFQEALDVLESSPEFSPEGMHQGFGR